MKYVNETVRRQDRLMDEAKALKLLENGEYGVLSMVSDGGGYGIGTVRTAFIYIARPKGASWKH